MPYAVELHFDQAADARVRSLWAALAEAGVSSPEWYRCAEYQPHVSLAVFEQADLDRLVPRLREVVAAAAGLPLRLAMLGFFLEPERSTAFLGVAASDPLLRLHREVDVVLGERATNRRPYYLPGAWTPHCTLPVDASDVAAVVSVVRSFALPVVASMAGAHLIDVGTGASAARIL